MKNAHIAIYQEEPSDFAAQLKVCACYVHVKGKVLLVQRSPAKQDEAGKWELPGGKLEEGEEPHECMARELFEETGIKVDIPFTFLGPLFVRKGKVDFIFYLFKVELSSLPLVTLSVEHQELMWASPDQIDQLDLISGGDFIISLSN